MSRDHGIYWRTGGRVEQGEHPLGRGHPGLHQVGHGQRQCCFRAGLDGIPLIGVQPGQISPRCQVDELGHPCPAEPMRLGKTALVLDRAGIRLQKVRSEGNDVLGFGKIVAGQLIDTEDLTICGPHGLGGEWLVPRPCFSG